MPEGRIPLARPWMDDREADAVRRVILSGWVTQGPEVAAFEREFAAFVGAQHACAVSSCTAALHLALRAVGVGPGDEVVTVSHSFVATANAIRYVGAVPVFVDVEPHTFNLDPELLGAALNVAAPLGMGATLGMGAAMGAVDLESAVAGRTRAILCVHQMGMPCDMARILHVARAHRLPVIEDAACAIGSELYGERIGKPHADIACFSFHPRKLLTTGDGGMLTTANPAYDAKFRLWRQHGMSVPDTARHAARVVDFESYEELGYNYRMTDLQAAVGRIQLERLPEMLRDRRALAARYRELLAGGGITVPEEPLWARSNWQSYCVRLPSGADQKVVMQAMLDQGVATRRGVMCAHREPVYAGEPWRRGSPDLRQSEGASQECILLPLFHGMTEQQQDRVVDALIRSCSLATSARSRTGS